jgi:hypothetical protein
MRTKCWVKCTNWKLATSPMTWTLKCNETLTCNAMYLNLLKYDNRISKNLELIQNSMNEWWISQQIRADALIHDSVLYLYSKRQTCWATRVQLQNSNLPLNINKSKKRNNFQNHLMFCYLYRQTFMPSVIHSLIWLSIPFSF